MADIRNNELKKEEIPRVYRKIVWIYDDWSYFTESKAARRVLELADIKDGESVLEVAVGTGIVFEQIVRKNPNGRNEGIDISESMLSKAKKRMEKKSYGNYYLELGDAYELSYTDKSFDVIINNFMFDLLPERDFNLVLREFLRVLKPSGRVIISSMAYGRKWYNRIWDILLKINPKVLAGCRPVLLEHYVKQAGFKNIKKEYLSQTTFPSEVIYGEK